MSDEVVALIAQDRSNPHYGQQCHQRQPAVALRGEEAGCEQQRVAGEEREEHHARLNEYDEKDEAERRCGAHGNPAGDCAARVLQQIDDEMNETHENSRHYQWCSSIKKTLRTIPAGV